MSRLAIALALLALLLAAGTWRVVADADPGNAPAPSTETTAEASSIVAEEAALPATTAPGASDFVYDRFCLPCHGAEGRGDGPAAAWLWPRPRDFTRGEFKWRSTTTGRPPTDADLAMAIRHGVPGTSMHGFGDTLTDAHIEQLIARIKTYAPRKFRRSPELAPVPAPPAKLDSLEARGKRVFRDMGCVKCHGESGAGNGQSAAELKDSAGLPAAPFDLTQNPLRRPRPHRADSDDHATTVGIYTTLVTGLAGTPMPSYEGAAPETDLWAVSAYVNSIRKRLPQTPPRNSESGLSRISYNIDLKDRDTDFGYRPSGGNKQGEDRLFGGAVPEQGRAPGRLTPAQASLSSQQCARCHASQERQWKQSLHAGAASPGLLAQLLPLQPHASGGNFIEGCQRCHAPLAEAQPLIRPAHTGRADDSRKFKKNPRFDAELREQGVNCASCHVRGWTRLGPPKNPGTGLLSQPGYKVEELSIYERSDFCMGCHQLPPRSAVAGKPRLNTYREWLEGPYMRRGIQCQHCHMPNREHSWKGVHDPDTFRQGIDVEAISARSAKNGSVSVRARVTNVGAGHFLPTTPTPAAWISVELVDRDGEAIDGAYAERRIGWHLVFQKGSWKELEDTRIPPGEQLELAAAWKEGRTADAVAVRVKVRVAPDDFYEGFYRGRLAGKLGKRERAMFEEALDRAENSKYVAYERLFPIANRP